MGPPSQLTFHGKASRWETGEIKATTSALVACGDLPIWIQLFREKLSVKVHATIPKGIVGGFEFTVLQRNLKEWHKSPWNVCLPVLKESNKSRFDCYSVTGNNVLIISHITFRDCRVYIFSDNPSRKS